MAEYYLHFFEYFHCKTKLYFQVFGERNIFKILFLIRIKKLPFSGLEWSRYLDENFAIKGIEEVKDN